MYKKLIAWLLVLCVTAGALTACSDQAIVEAPNVSTGTKSPAVEVKKEHFANPFLTEAEYQAIVKGRTPVQSVIVPDLWINGVQAVYDNDNSAYFFSVSNDGVWEKLELSMESYTVSYRDELKDGNKETVVSKGEPVSVIAYNDRQYMELGVIFSTLPVLSLETAWLPTDYRYFDADEEQDRYYDENGDLIPYDPYGAPSTDPNKPIGVYDTFLQMRLLDADAAKHGYENGFTSMARAHIRGRSSRQYPKNNYKLELLKEDNGVLVERDETLLGMRNDGDWNLNGMYGEATKVRDKVAADVWLAITADRDYEGVSTGYRTEYIEVIINGRYFGLYLLTERIDQKQVGLSDGDRMYFSEADIGKRPDDFLKNDDNEDMEISGYSLKYPKERSEPYEEWIPFGEFTKLLQFTNAAKYPERFDGMVDLDSLADYMIFVQAAVGIDNLIQNTFYVARQQDDGSYVFSFIPWDLDQTFGNRWTNEPPLWVGEDYGGLQYYDMSFWVAQPYESHDLCGFNALISERYKQLRKTVLKDENLIKMVNSAQSTLLDSGAWARNKERWPESAYGSISQMRGFIVGRMEFLDDMYS